MNRRQFVLTGTAVPLLGASGISFASETPTEVVITPDAAAVLDAINAYRAQKKRKALAFSARLIAAAQLHAEDLAARGYSPTNQFPGHIGADGSKHSTRVRRQGYSFRRALENVGYAHSNSQIVELWRNSPGHNKNLLDSKITQAGIGISGKVFVFVGGKPRFG